MTTTTHQAPARKTKPHGALRRLDMILFSVAAIMLLTQVPITAKEGPAVLFWTAVLLVFFFIPYGLITAELGSAWPAEGGVYIWVREAFGPRWGSMPAAGRLSLRPPAPSSAARQDRAGVVRAACRRSIPRLARYRHP